VTASVSQSMLMKGVVILVAAEVNMVLYADRLGSVLDVKDTNTRSYFVR
jgi:hypothetical protein